MGTVTAQLLYEIAGPATRTPTSSRTSTPSGSSEVGPDRVRLSGARGEPAPDRLKVAINYLGGFRNSMSFVLTGLDIEAKAAMAETALFDRLGGREQFQSTDTHLVGHPTPDPSTAEESVAELRITVKDPDPSKVGRAFSSAAIELTLANYPGCYTTTPPTDATPYGIYWPTLVRADLVDQTVVLDDGRRLVIKGRTRSGVRPALGRAEPTRFRAGSPGPADQWTHHPGAARAGVRGTVGRQGRERERRDLGQERARLPLPRRVPDLGEVPGAGP